ncbi:hypothetical protein [Amycolatopsis sp. RTGN1]|uniref:hypothetical protein n=1 Tax=Amycolatopsis ponsaeliensis TaxID=2992142 RepID=UPI00254D096A|nr:hypothetical protein [Amycolatopsis sp. RTGN1]
MRFGGRPGSRRGRALAALAEATGLGTPAAAPLLTAGLLPAGVAMRGPRRR